MKHFLALNIYYILYIYFPYKNISKDLSATYYHIKKQIKGFAKRLMIAIKIFLKKKKTKCDNTVVHDMKISQKLKNKGKLSIEEMLQNTEKQKLFANKDLLMFC